MAGEDAFTQKLVQFNSSTFARLQQQEYDWSAAFEVSESESEPDYLDLDYSGSEDDEIYQLAIKRARKNVVPEADENPNKVISTVVIERDQTLHYHPNSTILKAMGLPDEVFPPDSPSFAKRVRDLPMLLYLVWRFETYPGIQGGQYHAIQVPWEPTGPLEYVTINNITDAKSLTILTRAAELPGRRLKNYRDPIQKKNKHGYVFDSKVLSQYHKDSPERKTINALLGSEPIMAIRKMPQTFRRGLSEAEISSIFLWIDYNEDDSSAMIILQLSHRASEPGDSLGSFALDKQPPGVDPHLIITSRGKNPVYHPLSPPSYEIEPSYFEASAQYRIDVGRSLDFDFYYSTFEGHFVLGGLGQLGETLDDSDAARAGSILYSAWIREAGLKPILSVTFIDLSNAASSLVASIHGVQGSWILLDVRNNPEDFAILAQKLAETQCREAKLVQALLGMSGENFGQFQLVQLTVGINEGNKASLVLTIERGTRMKAEMEVLELRFLDEEAAMQQEVNSLPSGRVKQSEYQECDKTISFSKAIIGQYNFIPNKPLDCMSERKPPLLRDIISWNKELENPAHPEHGAYDDVQSQWRRKLAAAFNGEELFCTFTLSQKYPEHNPQDNQNQGNLEFGTSHRPGYVVLRNNGSAAPESKPLEYAFANTGSMLGCPQDIQGFIQDIPWRESESNIRKRITAHEVGDLGQLATEEISEEDKQAHLKGEMGPKLYKSFEYTRQYHPARYVFTVRAGPPYHLMVAVANDGQAGLSAEAELPRSTRIERLSRAYYDLFVRTMDLVRSPGSETRWISMRVHELSFETSSTIRNLYNMASGLVPNWQGFDISFTAGPRPTLQDNEEIQVGKTLLGLVEIGALGRMLSDYSRVMQNLKIARIIIRTAPNSEGLPDRSFPGINHVEASSVPRTPTMVRTHVSWY
ncbi:hypothetical protein TWF703_000013 [Orbilia oligospora]|uniref:Uncharacterized protein n=1 Tax=Orbilia oligospora TaxID=2813651 RepID=A0A7C8NWG0_ORBOL|nr:hypothetical protein TWF703_000013 [Orbilia oligospora]